MTPRARLYAVALLMLALTACNSWTGPSSVRLLDGRSFYCNAIYLSTAGLVCKQAVGQSYHFPWDKIAGYATGSEVR